MKNNDLVRVRFAPSPTGWWHIGNLRTCLYDFLIAKHHHGQFVLRIEDTDLNRKVPRGEEGLMETLNYLDLIPDEGPQNPGSDGPYYQSQRLDTYKRYAEQLVQSGDAYYCFVSKEELAEWQEQNKKSKIKFRSPFRDTSLEEAKERINNGEKPVIRLRIPDAGVVSYNDAVYGKITYKVQDLEDMVLLKADGYPTYNFANVIDDHLMRITHVLRGSEYLSSTPKYAIIYQALAWTPPIFVHLPVILNPDGRGKLSKRKGNVSVLYFLRLGIVYEALFNFLVLLGWTPHPSVAHANEIYDQAFLEKHFDFDRINKSSARFDMQKLTAFNGNWLRSFSTQDLAQRLDRWINEVVLPDWVEDKVKGVDDDLKDLRQRVTQLQKYAKENPKQYQEAVALVHSRARTLRDIVDQLQWLYQPEIVYDQEALATLPKSPNHAEIVAKLHDILASLPTWDQEPWEQTIRGLADEIGWKHGDLFMLLRLVLTGSKFSPPLRELMVLLGKETSLGKIQAYKG